MPLAHLLPLAQLVTRTHAQSVLPLRIFFGCWLVAAVCVALYFLRNREKLFSGRSGDRTTDSPAAGNLRMWMVILVLIHAIVILSLMIIEI